MNPENYDLLLIDDAEEWLELLVEIASKGFSYKETTSLTEALQLLNLHIFRLIVCDGLNHNWRKILGIAKAKNIPFILFSDSISSDVHHEANANKFIAIDKNQGAGLNVLRTQIIRLFRLVE